ncbi:MAG TPA: hypothetical protein VGW80_00710 [Solirubrobacterales bacterium]|jgi:hypothetical protein|nr:hypothetical protein [Solirubrobacterales bacterium]
MLSCLLVASLILAGLFLASAASAATVYRATGEKFAVVEEEFNYGSFGQLGVDIASGRVLVSSSGSTINVYAPSGDGAVFEGSFGAAELMSAGSLAIDQQHRVVYVGDGSVGKIFKYAISGTGPLTFTLDPTFESPTPGSEPGQVSDFGGPLAVDPSTGDLLLADRWNNRVSRYASDGTFISSFNGEGATAGAFHQLSSIAVDGAGNIYVVDITGGTIEFEYGGSVVERFAADGTPDNSFAPAVEMSRTVAIDPETGNLLVVGRSDGGYTHADGTGPYPIRLYTFNQDELVDRFDLPDNYSGAVANGLAVGAKRMYLATNSTFLRPAVVGVTVFDALEVPEVTFDAPTNVTTTTADVSGTVDPLGKAARYYFEYSREGGPTQQTAAAELGPVSGPQPVNGQLTGLTPNSEYSVRLVAEYVETGASLGTEPRTLKTAPAPPAVTTGAAVDVGTSAVTLLGTVNPFGQQTTYYFEYGPTDSYGERRPADHGDVAGHGREPLPVHGYLTGLEPGTTYHYRVVAENPSGVTEGADRTFTTDSAAAAPRFFEQVSPVEKGGSDVNGLRGFSASPDGETLMYQWKAAPAEGESAPVSPRSSAWRGPDGWTSTALDAPQLPGPAVVANPVLTMVGGISDDGTKVVTASLKQLAPGAVEGQSNYYVRDTRTGAYETITTQPGISLLGDVAGLGRHPVVDGTPDYSHILIRPSETSLLPGAPFGALYEYTDGELRIASVDENGTPLGSVNAGGTGGMNIRDNNYISDDGAKLFFQSEETGSAYLRIDGKETVEIGGYFAAASHDGRWAYVTGTNLTPDSPQDVAGLYRFDTEDPDAGLEFLTPTGTNLPYEGHFQTSANGASVFFGGEGAIVPEAEQGKQNLYVWHDGEVHLVATMTLDQAKPQEYMSSPNGSWFAFGAYTRLTDYDNRSKTACVNFAAGDVKGPDGKGVACKQIYRYDVENDELICASCPPDGSPVTGNARMGPENVEGDFNFPRAMLDDGRVIFDTTEPLSAQDSNSNRDVYLFDGSDTTLISGGRSNSRSEFDEASADGSSIFFTTVDQLVGQDKDTVADVYVSRVNGGIAAQNPPPPRGECIRDDCKETPNSGPEVPAGGSEALSGPGNVEPKAKKRCGKGRHLRKVKGKSRCVKKQKHKHHQKRADSNRRQGR